MLSVKLSPDTLARAVLPEIMSVIVLIEISDIKTRVIRTCHLQTAPMRSGEKELYIPTIPIRNYKGSSSSLRNTLVRFNHRQCPIVVLLLCCECCVPISISKIKSTYQPPEQMYTHEQLQLQAETLAKICSLPITLNLHVMTRSNAPNVFERCSNKLQTLM